MNLANHANTFKLAMLRRYAQRIHKIATDAASQALASLALSGTCNGYWHGGAGMQAVASHMNDKQAGIL